MQTTSTPTPTIHVGGIEISFLVEEQDSQGSATVFECLVPRDAMVPAPHSHDAFEETVYGLAGVTTFTVDGHARDIAPGDAICIRRGQVHHFVNQGSTDAKFLSVATPGIFGPAYFQEIRDILAAATDAPPDIAALVEVMRRHGLTPA